MQNKNVERAKQFLPFEALKGFKEAIRMIENKGDTKKELSEDNKNDINSILKKLDKGNRVKVKYYYLTEYIEVIYNFLKIDEINKVLYLKDTKINIEDIISINIIK